MLLSVTSFIGEPLGLGRKSEDPVRTRGFEVLGGVQEDAIRAERGLSWKETDKLPQERGCNGRS